jgi:phosphohistidine phosphatase
MSGRTLLVMRHAKSSWSTGVTDHERPLNARGRQDVPRIARALASEGWLPDHVLCSDAERTRETLAWMQETLEQDFPQTITSTLYLAGLRDLLRLVAAAPADARTLMILGHNPGCEEVVLHLTGDEIPMTTANVARLVAPAERGWAELVDRPCQFRLEGLLRPKEVG